MATKAQLEQTLINIRKFAQEIDVNREVDINTLKEMLINTVNEVLEDEDK